MCFGNKLNQNRPEHCITPFPTPNNFCGGFALNAVLVDLGSGKIGRASCRERV